MKTKLLLLFLITINALTTFAQDDPITPYTKDIGFNTNFILRGLFESSQTPFSFMYKSYSGETKATRYGLYASLQVTDTQVKNLSHSNTQKSYISVSLRIGKEFQNHISEKWVWYYGGDVVPSILINEYEYRYANDMYRAYSSKGYGLGVSPLLGIRYNVTPRVYVAAEANVTLAYNISRVSEKQYNPEETLQDYRENTLRFYTSPASGIYLFYRF